jgi:hypothetical protein
MSRHVIGSGPAAVAAINALLGPHERRRYIDGAYYERPSREGLAIAGGRYAIVTTPQHGETSIINLYADYANYRRAWTGALADVADPETGRLR